MPSNNRAGLISLPVERIHIEVTSRCNFSCEFCPDSKMERKRGEMDFSLFKKVVDEIAQERLTKKVFFHVMGEPLLYSRIIEAIGYVASKGLYTSMTTNGSLLTDKIVSDMADAGLSNLTLSLQTPDENTFRFRGARGVYYDDYKKKVRDTARLLIDDRRTELCISFLSSPLRRLIFPVMPEISIADTSKNLKSYLCSWARYILRGTSHEGLLVDVEKKIKKAGSFRENSVEITPGFFFKTRIMGDWAVHSIDSGVRAKVGFCPGIQENFGVLWNGDVVFCCVDYEGRTVVGNVRDSSIRECLESPDVQEVVSGFKRLRVVHPHCQRCMGDKNHLNATVRQLGSIIYFKGYRRLFNKQKKEA